MARTPKKSLFMAVGSDDPGDGKSTFLSTVFTHCADVFFAELETGGSDAALDNRYVHEYFQEKFGLYGVPAEKVHRFETWWELQEALDGLCRPTLESGEACPVRVVILDGLTDLSDMTDEAFDTYETANGRGWGKKLVAWRKLFTMLDRTGLIVLCSVHWKDKLREVVVGDDAQAKKQRSDHRKIVPAVSGESTLLLVRRRFKYIFNLQRIGANENTSIYLNTLAHGDHALKSNADWDTELADPSIGEMLYKKGFLTDEDHAKALALQEEMKKRKEEENDGQ